MSKEYITPKERLERITGLLAKGVCLYAKAERQVHDDEEKKNDTSNAVATRAHSNERIAGVS